MQEEIWKPVSGYEKFYQVSNLGRIKRLHREIMRRGYGLIILQEAILNPGLNKGYKRLILKDENHIGKNFTVHYLVASEFIPNPKNKPCIDHINGDRTDNRVENLRWCTIAENNGFDLARKHFSESKTGKKNPMYGTVGRKSPSHKPVLQFDKDGRFLRRFYGIAEAMRETGVQFKNISKVCKGERPYAGGFIWKYELNK